MEIKGSFRVNEIKKKTTSKYWSDVQADDVIEISFDLKPHDRNKNSGRIMASEFEVKVYRASMEMSPDNIDFSVKTIVPSLRIRNGALIKHLSRYVLSDIKQNK